MQPERLYMIHAAARERGECVTTAEAERQAREFDAWRKSLAVAAEIDRARASEPPEYREDGL